MSMPATPAGITELLTAWKQGDRAVENALAEQIYPVLQAISRSQLSRHSGAITLAATELANEAYERLHRQRAVDWQNRDHFFAVAATVVRRVVVDHIRNRAAEKRGGDIVFVCLEDDHAEALAAEGGGVDWLALDQALTDLAALDPACARMVELRVFSGLTAERIAAVTGASTATISRQWRFAKSWLSQRLEAAASRAGG